MDIKNKYHEKKRKASQSPTEIPTKKTRILFTTPKSKKYSTLIQNTTNNGMQSYSANTESDNSFTIKDIKYLEPVLTINVDDSSNQRQLQTTQQSSKIDLSRLSTRIASDNLFVKSEQDREGLEERELDIDNEDSKLDLEDLQNESRQDLPDEQHNACQTKQYVPLNLIGLMYRLDLSVLCSLRKSMHEHKYTLLSLAFGDSEIDKFNDIVLRYENKSIHIQIENVDKYYMDNDINYANLFTKSGQRFFINNYFDSFVKYLTSKSDNSLNNIQYLIIYTNSGLDLTEEKKFKKRQCVNFSPFRFDKIDMEDCEILKNFLFTIDNMPGRGFYQFSQDKTTKEELLKRLEFSHAAQEIMKERKYSQEEIKQAFLDKLVYAVNQPNREELNSIIKNEIEKVQHDYTEMRERILCKLIAREKLVNYIPGIMYEFNLLMLFLHDMFLHKNIFSVNSEGNGMSNNITIRYKDKITYVKATKKAYNNIGYSQLFPSGKLNKPFSIDKLFTFFVEKLGEDIEYFIIYTNADLDLTDKKELKKGQSELFYPLKFDSVDIRKEKYEILRDYSCINWYGLYQIAPVQTTRLFCQLKLPHSLLKEKEEGRLSRENEQEIKEKFLDKLIFAVKQCNNEELNSVVRNELATSNAPYNYEELHEIALRWSESHEFGPITKEIIEKLLDDIKNNRSSYQVIQNKNINEEIKFAKSVVGDERSPVFSEFLVFLVEEKKLEILKRNKIKPANVSSILNRARGNAKDAFEQLYDIWFDEQGDKKQCLKILENSKVDLIRVSSILSKAGAKAAKAFKDLYNLWFTEEGNETQYLKTLKKEGIDLVRVSSILHGAGAKAASAFRDLCDLWFDEQGNKTQYLKALERNKVDLVRLSSILGGAGAKAPTAFKDLHDLWFDEQGNKKRCLITLQKNKVHLVHMSSILSGAGANASKAFIELYDAFFNDEGNYTKHLKHFVIGKDDECFMLCNISSMLGRARSDAKEAFEELHSVCFNDEGKRTKLLNNFYNEGFKASNLSCMLCGSRARTSSILKRLHSACFNEDGKSTKLLQDFYEAGFVPYDLCNVLSRAADNIKEFHDFCFTTKTKNYLSHFSDDKEGFTIGNLCNILHGAENKVCSALKDFHDICFDEAGNRTHLLNEFYNIGFMLNDLSSVLSMAGNNAASVLRDFHRSCFNDENYLEHFLAERTLFTSKDLSKILIGVGIKIRSIFEKLHDLCFDKAGNKTKYLNNLIEEYPPKRIIDILYGKVRKGSTFLDEQFISKIGEQNNQCTEIQNLVYKSEILI